MKIRTFLLFAIVCISFIGMVWYDLLLFISVSLLVLAKSLGGLADGYIMGDVLDAAKLFLLAWLFTASFLKSNSILNVEMKTLGDIDSIGSGE